MNLSTNKPFIFAIIICLLSMISLSLLDLKKDRLLCQANEIEKADQYEKDYINSEGLNALEPEIMRNEDLDMNDDHEFDEYSNDYYYDDSDHNEDSSNGFE